MSFRNAHPVPVRFFSLCVIVLFLFVTTGCGGGSSGSSGPSSDGSASNPSAVPAGTLISLDDQGAVQSDVTVAGPDGSHLTLHAGTRIMLLAGDTMQTPTSQNNVRLSLVNGPGDPPILPAGITSLKYFRVVLTIDSIEYDASFWPASTDKGSKLVVVVNSQDVPPGTLGLLFDVSSGSAVRVGSSSLSEVSQGVASTAMISQKVIRAQAASGSSQMQFDVDKTGFYEAGGASPGTGPAPAGAFWCEFNVPDPGCITVGSTEFCGEKKVESVEITEPSTGEILADCYFGENDAGASGTIPPGYQFWCQRTPKPDGSTDIKISSMQANLPIIRAKIVRASDNKPMFWTYHKAIGGLHTPDGVLTDPYQKKEWQFAGYKKLMFTTKEEEGDYTFYLKYAVQPIKNAGYKAYARYFKATNPGFIGEVPVYDTLDGRVLIEDDVIKKVEKKWRVVPGEDTQGNRGLYEYVGKTYEGTATAVLKWPNSPQFKVWEITANVVFEKDKKLSTKDMDVYKATGTLTQTMYLKNPTPCTYTPESFTDTHQIVGGEQGDLWIKAGSDPVEYLASATIDSRTPLKSYPYRECCPTGPLGAMECTDKTLEPGEQEHMWLMTATGGSFKTAEPDGRLKDTFQFVNQGINGAFHEWDFAPKEKK